MLLYVEYLQTNCDAFNKLTLTSSAIYRFSFTWNTLSIPLQPNSLVILVIVK